MKIYYNPFYSGNCYFELDDNIAFDIQVADTQKLLEQIALHIGVHQEISSYPERLASYHQVVLEYDREKPENLFHRSIMIDSMNVAKTLLRWRDELALCGWNASVTLENCTRMNALAAIDARFEDSGLPALYVKIMERLSELGNDVPESISSLEVVVPCQCDLLPVYIQNLFNLLKNAGATVSEEVIDANAQPKHINEIHFSQQWKAEAWLSQQNANEYNVWINGNNKRLDNWLHMEGQPMGGCVMQDCNPQILQMFLLAVQLFQRPLNVSTLLQYLYLPECPLHWKLTRELSRVIVSEGGFCSDKVLNVVRNYIEKELNNDGKADMEYPKKEREDNYRKFLPFDLLDAKDDKDIVTETDEIDKKAFCKFMKNLRSYVSNKAQKIGAVSKYDVRIAQLESVAGLIDALMTIVGGSERVTISFKTLIQWAQSLYETHDYTLYNAQVGSRLVIDNPANIYGYPKKTIWCDFYGDVPMQLSTAFLSNFEIEQLKTAGISVWDRECETEFRNLMLIQPVRRTTDGLTLITCDMQGATKLPMHPLMLQLPSTPEQLDGDKLYEEMLTKENELIQNHKAEDEREICFDAVNHPFSWRNEESHSSLSELIQNPFDYFMKYILRFDEISATEINMSTTLGNVAHDTIEYLFTADRKEMKLKDFVAENYDDAFQLALSKKGALLLLPEHHLEKDRLQYLLKKCVDNLASIIQTNGLTVVRCEQEEIQNVGLPNEVLMKGYIDMLLLDSENRYVVFDLKWASKKDKFKDLLTKNRAAQLAIYRALLQQHNDHREAARTAFFVMPEGELYSTDTFTGDNCQLVNPNNTNDIMQQLIAGYTERRKEISEGRIETAEGCFIRELEYGQITDVYPLEELENTKKDSKKAENKYSDYKCFTK